MKIHDGETGSYSPGVQGLLAPLELWLKQPDISEILLNKPKEIWIEQAGKLIRHDVPQLNGRHLQRLFRLIANDNRQTLTDTSPLLSGNLPDGSRIQLCIPPASQYYTFSIRRQVVKHFTLEDYQSTTFYHNTQQASMEETLVNDLPENERKLLISYKKKEWDSFIRQAILAKKNIVISGGTSSGKTTFLNACLRQIPLNERLILLEDTREIQTPHENQVSLLSVKKTDNNTLNYQSSSNRSASVSMQDLVQCCLRLRPDRIIMGEIRGKEIMDFISSCSTGHEGSLTTVHANNPRLAFMRMTQMYKLNHVPAMTDDDILRELKSVIDIIIQVSKTPSGRQMQSVYYRYGRL